MLIIIFLSSGLFLGWSLGANDASNVFGTAVGTKMVKFKTAALICSIFVILGACISGAGASHTLGKLGAVNAIAGAFMVALAAALTVYWMTKLELPVSTSQAIVGAIIGWNFFGGFLTDYTSLTKIVSTWILSPLLAAVFAIIFFKIMQWLLKIFNPGLFRLDSYTRIGLIIVGAFGAYSLGANNIANVMGVFVESTPFKDINVSGLFSFTSTQQLFLLGAIAIGIGIFTYSYKVMGTVGQKLFKLTPQAALVVVLAESTVLFIFASQTLKNWLISFGLPSFPLVPVSSSQAVIGAVIGIGIIKGGKNIRWKVMGNIAMGWVTTPLIAGIVSFFCLFFLQNVFNQKVYNPVEYKITKIVEKQLKKKKLWYKNMETLQDRKIKDAQSFVAEIQSITNNNLDSKIILAILKYSAFTPIEIDVTILKTKIDEKIFTKKQFKALIDLKRQVFYYKWKFYDALKEASHSWELRPNIEINKNYNKNIMKKIDYLIGKLSIQEIE